MFDVLIRFGPLGVGLIFAVMSWGSWTSGEPPPWSVFGPKSTETVVESKVEEGRATNGSIRFMPVVTVTTSAQPQALEGLIPSFSNYSADMAANTVAAYPVGARVQVRWIDGEPMADRIDLFSMAHAVVLSLFAALFLFGGLLWAWAMGSGPKGKAKG
jgi:hypothetical protein